MTGTNSDLTIAEKIFHYKKTVWSIPFRELCHTLETFCEYVNPIADDIEPLPYIEYFFKNIDFDKIDDRPSREETLAYCNAIYYGLDMVFKRDIDKAIHNFQCEIEHFTKDQVTESRKKLIPLIGNLKRQARLNEPGISFAQRYQQIYEQIKKREKLNSIDYQILIAQFNEAMLNDLISSYELIVETLKEIPISEVPPKEESKMTPEQELQALFVHPGNIELYQKIKHFLTKHVSKDELVAENVVTPDHADNVVILAYLNKIIFPLLESVFIFEHEPLKCLSWIKGNLKQYERSYATFLQSVVLDCLRDKTRFPRISNTLNLVIDEFSIYDCRNLPNEPKITCGLFEYFTGKNSYSDAEKVYQGFMRVRGLLKTDKELVRDFIESHRDSIVAQLQSEIAPLQEISSQSQMQTKADRLKVELGKFGFFELKSVKKLSNQNADCLIESISSKGLPYAIAMFEYLGYISHLRENYFPSQTSRNKEISKWFYSDKDGRAVKGNISTLSAKTRENKQKYTAHLHQESVEKDYQKLI